MTNFKVPAPGLVVTVTTRFRTHYHLRENDYEETTYENVPVITPQNWTKPGEFCIPAEGEPFITFRTINIKNVVSLTVKGKIGEVETNTNTEYKDIAGGEGKTYTVTLVNGVASTCECLGFQYHKQCRHLRIAMGETPVNPHRETIKKQKAVSVIKNRTHQIGTCSKADEVRSLIREQKCIANLKGYSIEDMVKENTIIKVVEKLGFSRSLAKTYVTNNWNKV